MKTVVITGANRGIGLGFVEQYVAQGFSVFALCRQTSAQLSQLGATVIEGIDVCSDAGINNMCTALAGIKIDILICNAGILRDEQLGHLNFNTIREQFEVNAIAPLRIVEALEDNLIIDAKVALITSRMGSIADNTSGGRYGYRMSKAALNAAAMSLSHDLAYKQVSVGIYHPGYVQTDMVGNRGDISVAVASSRLVNLIAEQSMQSSGEFKHSNGQQLPW